MTDLVKIIGMDDGWEIVPKTGEFKPSKLPVGLWVKELKKLKNRLRYNLITLAPELDGVPFQPEDLDTLYCHLGEKGYQIFQGASRDAVLYAAKQNSYNPVVEELEYIENNSDIKPINLDKVATDYLGTNSELDDAKLSACLVGAIARALDHGCKMQYVLCLKGKQGLKKSEFWRILAGDYFCETQQDNMKDLKMAVGSCWIYEYPEIEILTTRKDVGTVKSFITARTDGFRPPYGGSFGYYPRKSILVGSLNEDEFLKDKTGHRRYWVVELWQDSELGEFLDTDKLARDRERILKAAILAYRSGRKPMLTNIQQNLSNRQNLRYENEHPFQSAIEQRVKVYGQEEFSIKNLLLEAKLRSDIDKITQKDMNEVSGILRGLGYISTKGQKMDKKIKSRARMWKLAQ